MTLNFEMDSRDRAVILLAGRPRLNTTLNQSSHESLRQRIVMNYHMGGMSKEESRAYINRKMEIAGSRQPVFDVNAIEAIINAAGGFARMVNKICSRCLIAGASKGQEVIDAETVRIAVEDNQLG